MVSNWVRLDTLSVGTRRLIKDEWLDVAVRRQSRQCGRWVPAERTSRAPIFQLELESPSEGCGGRWGGPGWGFLSLNL